MTKTYIIAKGAGGRVQWVSDHSDHMKALEEFHAEVNIAPSGEGWSLDDWIFIDADEALAAKIEKWIEDGEPASECPF